MAFWKFTGAAAKYFPSLGITAQPGYVYDLGSWTPLNEALTSGGLAVTPPLSLWVSDPGPATDFRISQETDLLGQLTATTALIPVSGQPDNTVGLDGDIGYDPATMTFYGPKASGAWPVGGVGIRSLGDQGMAGADETFSRLLAAPSTATATLTSGVITLNYFTARSSGTRSQMWVSGASTAAVGTTLCRFGVYSVDPATSDLTLVASTPNDTTLFSGTFATVQKAFSASFTITAGLRYAFAGIWVGATTAPNVRSMNGQPVDPGPSTYLPRIIGEVTGQTDLTNTINHTVIATPGSRSPYYARILP